MSIRLLIIKLESVNFQLLVIKIQLISMMYTSILSLENKFHIDKTVNISINRKVNY